MNQVKQSAQGQHIFTVSEVTKDIRLALENRFSGIWIEGEISGYKAQSSGHMYFSLKDETSILKCAFFKNENQFLKFKIEDGLKVLCFGRISVYGARGDYQLYVEKIELKGWGALQLAFQQLKEKLAKEGLFDAERKKTIPLLPQRIGIVTSPTGAAVRDMLKILRKRFPNLEIIIDPVRVQGEGSAQEIANAIDEFNRYGEIDVMIIARGGGSLEDLWAFNEEVVARAIFRSKVPVISAVGHEVDWTIADFVADLRASTPSNAAEIVVLRKDDLIAQIDNLKQRLHLSVENDLEIAAHKLERLSQSHVLKRPLVIVEQLEQRIDDLLKDILNTTDNMVKMSAQQFEGLAGKLHTLSPLAILGRGYSISFLLPDNKIIKNTTALSKGDRVQTKLAKGSFVSSVEEIL